MIKMIKMIKMIELTLNDGLYIYTRLINPGKHEVAYACPNEFIVDHMARNSYRKAEDGWRWKFDGMRWGKFNAPGA